MSIDNHCVVMLKKSNGKFAKSYAVSPTEFKLGICNTIYDYH